MSFAMLFKNALNESADQNGGERIDLGVACFNLIKHRLQYISVELGKNIYSRKWGGGSGGGSG